MLIKEHYMFDLLDINIVIISLKRRKNRLLSLTNQLDKLGLTYHIYDAWDARSHGYEETLKKLKTLNPHFNKFYQLSKDEDLRLGRMGCYISHYSVIKEAIVNQYNNLLVLEDDMMISDKFIEKPIENKLFYYLGFTIEKKVDVNLKDGWNEIGNYKVWGAGGYLVCSLSNLKELQKKINHYTPRAIDAIFTRFQKEDSLLLYPPLVIHNNNFDSDVSSIGINQVTKFYKSFKTS